MGWVKCKKHREYDGIIKSVTVTRTSADKYYISIMVETTVDKPIVSKKNNIDKLNVVGLDMSLRNFCVSSNEEDNMIIKYCRNYRKEEAKLARLNRRMSLRVKGSKNKEKARIRYAKCSEHVANRRKDFIIKTAPVEIM